MSVSIDEMNNFSASGFVSEEFRADDGSMKIHGVALGENDITRGHLSGERKLWRPEVLRESAEFLEGKDIVVDHENQSARETVGQVEKASYMDGVGIIYEGSVLDEELEPKIERGWLDVSPRIIHSEEAMELENDIKAPEEIFDIDNLSIVRQGASHSNVLRAGEHEELSEDIRDEFEAEGKVVEYQNHVEELQEDGDRDLSQWMYDSPEAADGAAERFGCSGHHTHDIEGETWYMPCDTHESFLRNLERADEDDLEDISEEFDSDFEGQVSELQTDTEEKRRLAGQVSSWSALTRDEVFALLETLDPNGPKSVESLVTAIERSFEDVDGEDVENVLDILDLDEEVMSNDSVFAEFQELDVDRREIGAALGDIWDVSTGEALAFVNAIDPNEGSDRQAIATIVSREYEGLDPVDVQSLLADAEGGSEEGSDHNETENKEKYDEKQEEELERDDSPEEENGESILDRIIGDDR